MTAERERLVAAITESLVSVSRLPGWMQPHALGRDMTPLAELAADAVLAMEPPEELEGELMAVADSLWNWGASGRPLAELERVTGINSHRHAREAS